MKNKKTVVVCFAAMFAALTAALTLFPKIPIPGVANGYVHLGDVMIYLSASILPTPYAVTASCIGGTAADILSGGAAWAPWTFFIKGVIAWMFSAKKEKILCKRNFMATGAALVITVLGYFAAEAVMYSAASASYSIIWNVFQGVASGLIYYALGGAMDKTGLKHTIISKIK